MTALRQTPWSWICAILVTTIDQVTKALTVAFLPAMSHQAAQYPYGGIAVFENFLGIEFSIVHATNKGAAWGIFADHQTMLLVVRILMIIAVIIYGRWYNHERSWSLPLALIIGGAISNVIDVFVYGHVIDMLHFILWGYDYPVFNVADSAICIGIAWIAGLSLFEGTQQPRQR